MGRQKVLLIVEGQKREVELFRKIFSEFALDVDYEIFPYSTNIHDLYERMFLGNDPHDLSLLGVLREIADDADKSLFDLNFSDVLLVFDYDPQDNRFSGKHLEEMQAYFNESTNEGKLYINYPMIEACKHFKKMPDTSYIDQIIRLSEVSDYKSLVSRSAYYQSIARDAGKYELSLMTALVAVKACCIVNPSTEPRDVAECYYDISHLEILKKQNELLELKGMMLVLGTGLLFIADYSSELADLSWAIKKLFG